MKVMGGGLRRVITCPGFSDFFYPFLTPISPEPFRSDYFLVSVGVV